MIEEAKAAGHVAAGYDQVFYTLAGLAALGIVAAALVQRPA